MDTSTATKTSVRDKYATITELYAEAPGGDPAQQALVAEKRKLQLRDLATEAGKACCTPGSGCC